MSGETVSASSSNTLSLGVPSTVDAAFRLHGLLESSPGTSQSPVELTPVWRDIDTLDHLAHAGELPVTMLSIPAYAYVQDRYRLLSCGARFGEGYGAMVVTYNPLTPIELHSAMIGVSGLRNSGFLALSLFLPQTFAYTLLPVDQMREAAVRGEVNATLLIGEEQLTHQALGLYNVVDLGAWWLEQTDLPFPLEALAVRRDLPEATQREIARVVRRSVQHSLTNRGPALGFAYTHARKMDRETTDSYVGMYVNEQSIDMHEVGRDSIEMLLKHGAQRGLIPTVTHLDILDATE